MRFLSIRVVRLCLFTVTILFQLELSAQYMDGQIRVDPDHSNRMVYHNVWVEDHGTLRMKPCVFVGPGDPEDLFYNNTEGNRNFLVSNGARCTYVTAYLHDFGGGDPGRDLTLDKRIAEWDAVISAFEKAGIITVFFFYDDSYPLPPDWSTDVEKIVSGLKHHKLLVWSVAEEYGEAMSINQVSEVAKKIKAVDNHNHIVAVHQNSGTDFHFNSDNNLDMFAIQYNVKTPLEIHSGMIAAFNDTNGNKILNLAEIENHAKLEDRICRQLNWAAVMGGASAVQVLWMGRESDPETWNSDKKYADCAQLMDFMQRIPDFNDLVPRQDILTGATALILSKNGISYVVYSSSLSGDIGIKKMVSGEYDLIWLDVLTGTEFAETRKIESGTVHFKKPDGFGSEVALYITTTQGVEDSSPPSVPGGLVLKEKTASSVSLVWDEAEDNISVAGYIVDYNGKRTSFPSNSGTIEGLAPATAYSFRVSSVDASGNESAFSKPVGVVTNVAGQNPPEVGEVPDQVFVRSQAIGEIEVSGISDGDGMTEEITVNASSEDETIAEITSVRYSQGDDTAIIRTNIVSKGTTNFTFTVTDGSGTVSITFRVTVCEKITDWNYKKQAEDYDRMTGSGWMECSRVSGYFGSGYMQTVENASGRLHYDVNFPVSGRYFLYLRNYAYDHLSNGVHLEMDNVPLTGTGDYDAIYCIKISDWNYATQWQTLEHGVHYGPVYLDVNSPGKHTMTLRNREANWRCDEIVIVGSKVTPPGDYSGTTDPSGLSSKLESLEDGYSL